MNIVMLDAATLGDDLSFDALRALGSLTVFPSTTPSELLGRVRDTSQSFDF